MSKHVEVRATIHMPGVAAGQVVLVDPELPYMKMCLDAGHLVPTGREFSVPTLAARGAVRPPAKVEEPVEPEPVAAPAAKKPKRAPRKRPPKKADAAA